MKKSYVIICWIQKKCLMIGNDVEEDMMTSQFGMQTWLLTDNLIHRGSDYQCDWSGSRRDLLKKIKELF